LAPTYITNDLGDIHEVEEDGVRRPVDPSDWGWLKPGGKLDRAEMRRSIDALRALPGMTVEEEAAERFVPGTKKRGARWKKWEDGTAPPAAVESRGGVDGTLAYFDRLSEAVGSVAYLLPRMPGRSPMLIHDFVVGRLFRVSFKAPAPSPTGKGTVYLIEDGYGIKIGYTTDPVAKRMGALQTGNSRRLTTIAEIFNADGGVEDHLHARLNEWNTSGEWFDRSAIVAQATGAGGFEPWLRALLGGDGWQITVHPLYR
jgi:hypothetical protein